MGFTIDISKKMVIRMIKKYCIILILLGLLVGGLSTLLTIKVSTGVYESSGELVQNDNNTNIISSYEQFINSVKFKRLLKEKVMDSSWKNKSQNYQILISTQASSPFFSLHAKSSNQQFSTFLANASMKILITNIGKYLSGTNISIVTSAKAEKNNEQYTKSIKNGIYAFIASIIIGFIWVYYSERKIGKIKDDDFISDVFSLKKLGKL